MPPNEFRVLAGSRAIEHDRPALTASAAGADDERSPPGGAHESAAGSHRRHTSIANRCTSGIDLRWLQIAAPVGGVRRPFMP
jgi:hypothetical protein